MAEFQEVMKQWLRMCKAYSQCEGCKLNAYDELGYKYSCHENGIPCNIDRVELVVMAWAAEHPEPVYPTWWSWLINEGVIEKGSTYKGAIDQLTMHTIPDDIAQKLGIKPMEVNKYD